MKRPETRLIHTRMESDWDGDRERGLWSARRRCCFSKEESLYGPKPTYGRMGLTVHRELEAAMNALEKAQPTPVSPTACSLLAGHSSNALRNGDHLLFPE